MWVSSVIELFNFFILGYINIKYIVLENRGGNFSFFFVDDII